MYVGRSVMLEQFTRDVQGHELEILHDEGLYRHLEFCDPATDNCSFQLFTAPGTLGISRGRGTYIFARLQDMFRFFDSPGGKINPAYWSEKVTAQDVHYPVRMYSEDRFKQVVLQDFEDRKYAFDPPDQERLRAYLTENVLQSPDIYCESGARDVLRPLQFSVSRPPLPSVVFDYSEFQDQDFKDFSHSFLWSLEAVVWGIRRYRETTGHV